VAPVHKLVGECAIDTVISCEDHCLAKEVRELDRIHLSRCYFELTMFDCTVATDVAITGTL
jgi:hypothetical protein